MLAGATLHAELVPDLALRMALCAASPEQNPENARCLIRRMHFVVQTPRAGNYPCFAQLSLVALVARHRGNRVKK
jgi:gamma-glutamyl:cysteine ligase YbdK (ATP-grasp superfamily)